ncbi:MAG: hypothetical protein PUA83_10200 [Clostridiales bacterium]|nr:hypothetical protein [Clostridiales bacterium]
MITEEKEKAGAEPSVECSVPKKSDVSEKRGLVIGAELFASVLFLAVASIALYIGNRPAEAIAVAAALRAAGGSVWTSVRQYRDLIGLGRTDFRRLMYVVYDGRISENGLRMPFALRLAPLALSALCAAVCLVRAIFGGVGDYGTALSILTVFCAAATMGVELPAMIAAANGAAALKQRDIEVGDAEKLGSAAKAKFALADKSVFFALKGTETGGVYINGKVYGVSELGFSELYPMIVALNVCDDGALSAAFGFRQRLTDSILRSLRTTQLEHGELFGFQVEDFVPYDPVSGVAQATCVSGSFPDPRIAPKTYLAGKPDAIIPHLRWEFDSNGLRELNEADFKRIRLHLRQTYAAGREVIAVASRADRSGDLALIGFLHVNCVISEEARESVNELRDVGVELVYVSEENESCAFYHARELGVARDMSQVLTGSRIDRFRPENLVRAARHARLCAEAGPSHRRALTRMLASERIVMAASKSGDDELLQAADVRITSAGGKYSTDFSARGCSIEDVSLVARVARSVCAAAKRAEYQLFCGPVCAMLLSLFTLTFYGEVPFGAAAMVLLSVLLPLPLVLMTAKMDVCPSKRTVFALVEKSGGGKAPLKAGLGLAAWNLTGCFVTAVFACWIYGSYAQNEAIGAGGASSAAFLTVCAYMLANGLVCRAWDKSILSLKDDSSGVKFIVAALVLLVLVFGALRISAAAGVFGMSVLAYSKLPFTILPAVCMLLAYEIGGAVIRRRKSSSEK